MHFEIKKIYYVIKYFLIIYIKITILIFALNTSFLNNFNDKFLKLILNINKKT